tara:strand:+ start:361 stop:765 length:405 start_codon:yes stop_codon:yes gene_type:complete
MLKKFNHLAIAVKDISKASQLYKKAFNAKVSTPHSYPKHGVRVVFVEMDNSKIELMEPINNNSPISNYLNKNPEGGIHHICIEVKDIHKARDNLMNKGFRILGDGKPKIGAHDKLVLFLHPKDFNNTLIELEQE